MAGQGDTVHVRFLDSTGLRLIAQRHPGLVGGGRGIAGQGHPSRVDPDCLQVRRGSVQDRGLWNVIHQQRLLGLRVVAGARDARAFRRTQMQARFPPGQVGKAYETVCAEAPRQAEGDDRQRSRGCGLLTGHRPPGLLGGRGHGHTEQQDRKQPGGTHGASRLALKEHRANTPTVLRWPEADQTGVPRRPPVSSPSHSASPLRTPARVRL